MNEWNIGHHLHRKVVSLWELHSSLPAASEHIWPKHRCCLSDRHQTTQEFGNRELNYYTHSSYHMDNSGKKGKENINKQLQERVQTPNFQFFWRQWYIRPLPSVQIKEFWVFSLLIPSGCMEMERRDTYSGWDKSMLKKFSGKKPPPFPSLLHHQTGGLKQQFKSSCMMWLLLKGSWHEMESLISSFSSAQGRHALVNTHWFSWKGTSGGSGLGLRLNSQTPSQPNEGGAVPGVLWGTWKSFTCFWYFCCVCFLMKRSTGQTVRAVSSTSTSSVLIWVSL